MKETINYYYKVYPDKIYEINSGVYFYFNDFKYYFIEFTRTKEEINLLVKISNDLYNKHVLVNTFILTKDNNYFVELNDKIMILLRVNSIESDTNTLKDLIYFRKVCSNRDWMFSIVHFSFSVAKIVDNLIRPIGG